MSDTAKILNELADDYRRQAGLFEFASPNSSGEATGSVLLDVSRDLRQKAEELAGEVDCNQIIKDLWNTVQILVSRYPGCETLITTKEIEERPDIGVVVTTDVDGGTRLKVRQR